MLGKVGDNLQGLINARGRSGAHVAEGALICAAAVLLSAVVAARTAQPIARREAQGGGLLNAVWPPLALALTFSGLRIWNAPASPERSRALGLWGALQLFSAMASLVSPRRRIAQLAAAAGALGAGIGYAASARKVDATAAALVSPYLGWGSVAGLIKTDLLHRAGQGPTLH